MMFQHNFMSATLFLTAFGTTDWYKIFVPQISLLEIFIRGTIMYLSLFILLRITLKRESASLSITDLLVIVLIADAAQNGMAGDYHSITEGLLLVSTLLGWSLFLDWLSFRSPAFHKMLYPKPLLLIDKGELKIRNLRKEYITLEELKSYLREQGIDDIKLVKKAYMEPDGQISAIPFGKEQQHKKRDKNTGAG